MKDLAKMRLEFKELEKGIQRLKELEKELNSLNTESFESEVNAIKSKLKDPRKVKEIEKDFAILKRKAKEREEKLNVEKRIRNKALDAISEAEKSLVHIIKDEGVIITGGEELLIKSKQALDKRDYGGSIKLSEELKELTTNREKRYREAKNWLKSAESTIEMARKFGCNVFEAKELLNKATSEFERGNYEEAISDAGRSEEMAKEIKEEAKPEIEVDLSKKDFRIGVWEKVLLKVLNKGNANAKNIEIEFKRAEVEGFEILKSLGVGEKRDLKLDFMPKDAGSVPLKIDVRFEDLDGNRYEEPKTVYINVGEVKGEELKEKEYEIPVEKEDGQFIIERAIYDPCKGDFIEGQLPRMKEWINRYDPGAYWFAISIQNNTDRSIEGWDVELEMSSALKVSTVKIEGIEIKIPHETHLKSFKISAPKEYGIVIPKGGAQRVYFKLRAEKPKTTYEISGVFKSAITGDVPIRPKEFKYLCDVRMSPEAVKPELKKTFSEKDAARLTSAFKTVQEMDRMCNYDTKTEKYLDKLLVLKNYTEGFSDTFTKQVVVFARFMKEEQLGYLDDEYKGKVRRFCTNLFDVFTNEFLKG